MEEFNVFIKKLNGIRRIDNNNLIITQNENW